MKKVDSGNEFTQRRLVEMESTMDRKMSETNETVCKSQADSASLRGSDASYSPYNHI